MSEIIIDDKFERCKAFRSVEKLYQPSAMNKTLKKGNDLGKN